MVSAPHDPQPIFQPANLQVGVAFADFPERRRGGAAVIVPGIKNNFVLDFGKPLGQCAEHLLAVAPGQVDAAAALKKQRIAGE